MLLVVCPERIVLSCGVMIQCKVTDNRQYLYDVSQGGLEIPCLLIFAVIPNEEAMSSASAAAKITTQ